MVDSNNYLDDRQELPDLTRLDRLDLQLNLFGVVLGCCGLKLDVERQHRRCLGSRGGRLFVGVLCLGSQGIEFANNKRYNT